MDLVIGTPLNELSLILILDDSFSNSRTVQGCSVKSRSHRWRRAFAQRLVLSAEAIPRHEQSDHRSVVPVGIAKSVRQSSEPTNPPTHPQVFALLLLLRRTASSA
jgi:hypothetical protein